MSKSIPDSLKLILYEETGYQCANCGHRDGLDLTVHHVIPRETGGQTDYSNLIVLCHNCHHRIHESKTLKDKDIRRIKRHLVNRYFTQAGANAAVIAYQHDNHEVPVAPYVVEHLVNLGFFKHVEDSSSITWTDEVTDEETSRLAVVSIYRLTAEGMAVVKQWLLRSPGEVGPSHQSY